MPTYTKANREVTQRVANVLKRYHGPKADAGVLVNVVMAHPSVDANDDPLGPAITVNGYPAIAKIRILGLKDRVSWGCDAEMVLDSDHWSIASVNEQDAIVDHELTHLELLVDGDGNVKRDDADRPRLRLAKHDRQFGWFDIVAHRHGESSVEIRQCREMLDSQDFKQTYLFDLAEEAAA